MTLQVRFVLLISLLVGALAGGLWLHDRINTTDTSRLRASIETERTALLNRLVDLTTEQQRVFTADYAPWDEMVAFVRNPDPEWGRINLDAAIDTHHVEAVWVFTPDLVEVYGVAHANPADLQRCPLPPDALRSLTANPRDFHCFLVNGAGLVEIRGEPVRPSDRSIPVVHPSGWLLSGRRWNEAYLQQLQGMLGGAVTIATGAIPAPGPEEVLSTRALPDWRGQPVRTLLATFHAQSLERANADARMDLVFLFTFGAAALAAFALATNLWVVQPLRRLERSLRERDPAPLAGLIRAGGEFGALGRIVAQSFQQEEKLQQIYAAFNAIDDAVFITDPVEGRILHVNLGATRLLGYPDNALLGRTVGSLAVRPPEAPSDGVWWRTADGRLLEIEIHDHALPAKSGQMGVTVARDISDRRRLETQRLRAQRMESLGTLAGGVAHDMNNLLTPIVLLLDQFQDANGSPPPALIASVRSAVKRGAGMLRQLLTFGRGFEGERAPLAIERLIEEIARIVESTFPKAISFQTHIARELPAVVGDVTQLHQVLLNLCVNARDAMPQGGVISVSASSVHLTGSTHEWPDAVAGEYVRVEVSDNGVGIAPEHVERIFDPFFTTKAPDKGTGLGLSTTLGIIRGHGGHIQVRSQLGRGSTFSLLLPAADGARAPFFAESPETADRFDGAGRTVLVVEDEDSILLVLAQILSRLGFKTLPARDGNQGIALYHQHRADIAAVITDLQMPERDGLAVLQAVRAEQPHLPVLVMSGRVDEAILAMLRQEGMTRLIDKPFGMAQIVAAMRATFS